MKLVKLGVFPYRKTLRFSSLLILFLMVCCINTHAYTRTPAIKTGVVMARSIALDKNNQPILVEYKEDGTEGGVVPIPGDYTDRVKDLVIISAAEYHLEKKRLEQFKEQYKNTLAKDAEVKSRDDFLGQQYPTADGKQQISPPALPEFVKSVLVRGRSNRITNDPDSLVLLKFSIDFSQNVSVPEKGSVVLNGKGQYVYFSTLNIAPRVGFFGNAQDNQSTPKFLRKPEDTIFGPVSNVRVYISPEVYPGSQAVTDKNGKYHMSFLLPYCPGGFHYTTDAWAELRYANFNPNGAPTVPYYLRVQDWTYCFDLPPFGGASLGAAMDYVNALGVLATRSIPVYNVDLKVDVMFLSGKIVLKNVEGGAEIPVSGETTYDVESPSSEKITQEFYDFDGDGQGDDAKLGNMVDEVQPDGSTKKVFKTLTNGPLQAVYFSSNTTQTEPDAIRLADTQKNKEPNGLLKTIKKDDLKNTDFLVFRESTGQLVVERKGLKDEEIDNRAQVGLGKDDKYFYYRLLLRGPRDSPLNVGGAINRRGTYTEWATRYKLEEPFRKREADHLKSGEWVRLVAINRATGYVGTQRLQLNDASDNGSGYLSLPVKDIEMLPPNLKIWAERDYTQQSGLDQGEEEKNNIIGMEGVSLTTDDKITVYTEWLDHDGRALPEDLGKDNGEQYGLTGRLAKVTGQNQLTPVSGTTDVGSRLSEFPIAPGRHTQVLRLNQQFNSAEHFYIHVNGTQKDERPDFGQAHSSEKLPSRPDKATPFLIPQYEETKEWKAWSAYAQAKRQYDAELIDEEPGKPIPSYAWTHRPEYQFSQLSLEVDKIQREFTDESGQTQEQELLLDQKDGKIPTIRSDDDVVSVFYSLIQQQQSRLRPLEGEQELVFGFGASEVRATISATGKVEFKDIAQIDFLDPVDFLTIRLYMNHDAGNTLWEWAFTRNGLHVYFQVPGNTETRNNKVENDIEILSLLQGPPLTAAAEAAQEATVRTLGGMRLRYRYQPPAHDGIELKKIEWKIAKRGRYCNNYGVLPNSCTQKESDQIFEQRLTAGVTDANIYWEPMKDSVIPQIGVNDTDWSNWAGTATNDDGVKAHLKAEYTIPAGEPNKRVTKYYERDFVIKTRELKPESVPANVMKGSDVQMLEAMLWQLGISPAAKIGTYGTRLKKDKRASYETGTPSLEKMVKRFQGRNVSNAAGATTNGGGGQSGVVNTKTIQQLERVWIQYIAAYEKPSYSTPILTSAVTDKWLEPAIALWNTGYSTIADGTYTQEKHDAMLTAAGLTAGAKSREDLLRKWKTQEVASHWGQGSPITPYRMTEGGSDEYGSLSFNQVLYKYRYSDIPCKGHKDAAFNFYDPIDNIRGFALHTAIKPTAKDNCPGAFDVAYRLGSFTKTHSNPAPLKYRHNTTGTLTAISNEDDAYEVLAKAIAGYNGGLEFWKKDSWANLLRQTQLPSDNKTFANTLGGRCSSCKYSIEVRNVRYGLPYRQYIWKGGKYPKYDLDADGEVKKDAQGNPILHPKSEQDWCFAYGEQEWIGGVKWSDAKDYSERYVLGNPKENTTDYRAECN
jgi:hypothetical protein